MEARSNMKITRPRVAFVGVALTLALTGAACSSDSDSASADTSETTAAKSDSSMKDDSSMQSDSTMKDDSSMKDDMSTATPTGPACSAVPADGAGSFEGMAAEPVATAASANPLLSTLVTAVGEAGLVDTLNGPGPFTVFAPVNDAFAKIPADDLKAVLADKAQLTKLLTFHVASGEMTSADLIDAGTVKTVEGGDLTIEKSGDSFTVNGANVLCADVPTANATVFLIDSVMMPS
ncbi:MAG: fasciclin domain-containing protein [Microthrixaceae bacterium]